MGRFKHIGMLLIILALICIGGIYWADKSGAIIIEHEIYFDRNSGRLRHVKKMFSVKISSVIRETEVSKFAGQYGLICQPVQWVLTYNHPIGISDHYCLFSSDKCLMSVAMTDRGVYLGVLPAITHLSVLLKEPQVNKIDEKVMRSILKEAFNELQIGYPCNGAISSLEENLEKLNPGLLPEILPFSPSDAYPDGNR